MYRVNSTVRSFNCQWFIHAHGQYSTVRSQVFNCQRFIHVHGQFNCSLLFLPMVQTSTGSIQLFVPLTADGSDMNRVNLNVRTFICQCGSDKYRINSTVCSFNCRWVRYELGQFKCSYLYLPMVQTSTGSIQLFVPLTANGSYMHTVNIRLFVPGSLTVNGSYMYIVSLNVRSFTCQWFRQVQGRCNCLLL